MKDYIREEHISDAMSNLRARRDLVVEFTNLAHQLDMTPEELERECLERRTAEVKSRPAIRINLQNKAPPGGWD